MKKALLSISLLAWVGLGSIAHGLSPAPSSFWDAGVAAKLQEGIWVKNEFGHFRVGSEQNGQGWVLHQHHGWLWVENDDLDNLLFYSESLGWMSTNSAWYPYLYTSRYGRVIYIKGTGNPRWFYSFADADWRIYELGYGVRDYFTRTTSPVLKHLEIAELPDELEVASEEESDASVVLNFLVTEEGMVEQVGVSISQNAEVIEYIHEVAIRVLAGSTFSPGTLEGRPVTLFHSFTLRLNRQD
jgi:hypothetical protein